MTSKITPHIRNIFQQISKFKPGAPDCSEKKYISQSVRAQILVDILRVKAHLQEYAINWKANSAESIYNRYTKLEFTLNTLLDNIIALLEKKKITPQDKVELIEQYLGDFIKHLEALDQLIQTIKPPSQQYHIFCDTTNQSRSFDDYDEFVACIQAWRTELPSRRLRTKFPTSIVDKCLLTQINGEPKRVLTKVKLTSMFNQIHELPVCIVDTGAPTGLYIHTQIEQAMDFTSPEIARIEIEGRTHPIVREPRDRDVGTTDDNRFIYGVLGLQYITRCKLTIDGDNAYFQDTTL